MRSFAAIALTVIALSQVAFALPQDIGEGVADANTKDSSLFIGGSLAKKLLKYVRENATGSLEGSIGGTGEGGYQSHFIPGLGGGIKGNFGATGTGSYANGLIRGDGDIGGSGSGGIGVGKGYGFTRSEY